MSGPSGELTVLLHRAQGGDATAIEQLFEESYPLVSQLARARLRAHERTPHARHRIAGPRGLPALRRVRPAAKARALLALGRTAESAARLDAAESFWTTNPNAYGRMLVEGALVRAEMTAVRGNPRGALTMVTGTLKTLRYPDQTTSPGLDRALRLSARLHEEAGDAETALAHASAALALAERLARNPRASADVGEAALLRARAQRRMGRVHEARDDASLAVEALGAGLGPAHALTMAAVELTSELAGSAPAHRGTR